MVRKLSEKASIKRVKDLKKKGYKVKEVILPSGDIAVFKKKVKKAVKNKSC